MKELNLTAEEKAIINLTLRSGNLNVFSNYFMRLPNSGSLWMPEDSIGHYRHLFTYEMLHDLWGAAGKPDDFDVRVGEHLYHMRVLWDAMTPHFLYPPGYLFLPWIEPIIDRSNNLALAITGTGTGKTAGIAVAALCYCALYPGFHFLNVAPSTDQASLMIDELEKWIVGTPFGKFVQPTRSGEMYLKKPYPHADILSPLDPSHASWFVCQTVGRSADNILGKNQDWISIDECQLMNGIAEAMPKLTTRMRAQRGDGTPRWTKLSMLTNPGDNPELSEIQRRVQRIAADPVAEMKATFIEGVDSSVNCYNTKKQMAFHRSLMDTLDQDRWLGGQISAVIANRMIPETLLTKCYDEELNLALRENPQNPFNCRKRDNIGIIHYEIPFEQGHYYIVTGDPGQGNPVKMSLFNLPIVTVFDITNFLEQPSRLVYFSMIDGNGSYEPWIREFQTCMVRYRSGGYYDATNFNSMLEDTGTFTGFQTTPITFAVMNKRWARGTFVRLAQDGLFAWPHLERLWHEAAIYRETGEGHLSLADDVLASMFVYCLALRIDGGLWDRMVERYHWEEEPDDGLVRNDTEGRMAHASTNRYARSGGRTRRR